MASENGDDLDDEIDDGDEESVEISIEPRQEILDSLGVEPEEFEETLAKALDEFEAFVEGLPDDADLPTIDEAPITLRGRTFALGDVAEIEILGDDEGEGDEEE